MNDPFQAFCTHATLTVASVRDGPLAGLTFAAKDNYAVAGHAVCAGNPDWLRTHGPADRTAPAVARLLAAGATLVGKTQMEELAFGLEGRNAHFGTPVNPRAPDRIPGGSSSGSAAATAGGLVDFALGSDTGGSVRVPASHCGLFGIRPTHGRISLDGIVPFSPSFDTVGWFSRSAELLRRVGQVLLDDEGAPAGPRGSLLIAEDAFALADEEIRAALQPAVRRVAAVIGQSRPVVLGPEGFQAWVTQFNMIRSGEVRETLGPWIDAVRPAFGPGIRERFEATRAVTAEQIAAAREGRRQTQVYLDGLLGGGDVVCLPTVPVLPPRRDDGDEVMAAYRSRTLLLTAAATVGELPQVTLPLAEVEGCPVGLSLLGGRGADLQLLRLAEEIVGGVGG